MDTTMEKWKSGKMRTKSKNLYDYREKEVRSTLGNVSLDQYTPKHYIEEETFSDSVDPETIEELINLTTPEDLYTNNEANEVMNNIIDSLTPREAKLLRLRFGINLNTDHTLEEIASMYRVGRERVRQIEAKALRKMRHPTRTIFYKSLLDPDAKSSLIFDTAPPKMEDYEYDWEKGGYERFNRAFEKWEEQKRTHEAQLKLMQARLKPKIEDAPF